MHQLWQDVRFSLRTLAKNPGFTAVAILSLSLGICIATCAYSEMNGLILRDLPAVPNPQELVALESPTSYPNYQRYRELRDVFTSTFAYVAPVPFAVSLAGRTERTWGHLVTPSYFSTLGVKPFLGRTLGQGEEQPGGTPTVLVSYRFWETYLGSDPAIIGRALRVNGQVCTIIGVGPQGFLGASPIVFAADLWIPVSVGGRLAPELANDALERRDLSMFRVVGRLQPGVTEAGAQAELDAVTRQLEQAHGDANRDQKGPCVLLATGGKMMPLRKQDMPLFTEFFMVLAGLVMLIACSNVANMMLVRTVDRRREIAVRVALGASRIRIIRQLLTESVLVAAAAGMLGFILAAWLMHLLSRMRMPFPMPISYDLNVDRRAFFFTLGVTLLAGLFFGLAPAWRGLQNDLISPLKEGGTVRLHRYGRLSLRNLLVVSQTAGSLMLPVITGMLALGIQTTLGIQEGFNPKNLYLIALDPVRDGYSSEQSMDLFHNLLERMQRLPSVTAACLTGPRPPR